MAQVKNKTASKMVLKPAPIERSQTVALVKANRAWARAGSLRASAAEPIPAALRPVPKKALCILPMIRREELSGRNRPVVAQIRWKAPRTDGARHISTAAIRGHSGDRHRAHHHPLPDLDGHHDDRRRVHHGNRDRRLRDSGGLRGDSHSEDDSLGVNCRWGQHCPTDRARPVLRRIRRARQSGQRRGGQAQTRSKPAPPIPHPAVRAPAWTERRC